MDSKYGQLPHVQSGFLRLSQKHKEKISAARGFGDIIR